MFFLLENTDYLWDTEYYEGQSELRLFVPGSVLSHLAWVFRTGVGGFQSSMQKLGLALISICGSGSMDQNAAHAILECPLHRASWMLVLDDESSCWLYNI